MTVEKGRAKVTLTNGVLPPGSNELDGTKYLWDGTNTILNIVWTSRKVTILPEAIINALKLSLVIFFPILIEEILLLAYIAR